MEQPAPSQSPTAPALSVSMIAVQRMLNATHPPQTMQVQPAQPILCNAAASGMAVSTAAPCAVPPGYIPPPSASPSGSMAQPSASSSPSAAMQGAAPAGAVAHASAQPGPVAHGGAHPGVMAQGTPPQGGMAQCGMAQGGMLQCGMTPSGMAQGGMQPGSMQPGMLQQAGAAAQQARPGMALSSGAQPVPGPGTTYVVGAVTTRLTVTVPGGIAGGELVRVAAPDGSYHSVMVPAGLSAGQQFSVRPRAQA